MRNNPCNDFRGKVIGILSGGILGRHADKRLKQLVFVLVFVTVYLLSGILTIATSGIYRMGLVSALVIPLILLYGIELDLVTIAIFVLVIDICISALINRSTLADLVLFLRIPAFGYLMYYLAKSVVNVSNVGKILRACVLIAIIQLPVMLAQNAIVGGIDSDFGTFNFKTDYALSFFALAVLIVLLFNQSQPPIIKGYLTWPVATWLSLTVFASNAQITKLILVGVWTAFLISRWSVRRLAGFLATAASVAMVVVFLFNAGLITEDPIAFVERIPGLEVATVKSASQASQHKSYLEGGYDRSGAIKYFLSHPVNWFGDGPSRYYDVLSRKLTRGNMGHVYRFYSETGLISWLLSILVFFGVALVPRWRPKWSPVGVLIFIGVNVLAFTSHVMNDIAVMLIYSIVGRSQWEFERRQAHVRDPEASVGGDTVFS